MSRPALLSPLFWLAFAVSTAAVLVSASGAWMGRSDAAGRGMAAASFRVPETRLPGALAERGVPPPVPR